jgi:hypothetical protein
MNVVPVMNDKLSYTLNTHLPEDGQDMWSKRVEVVCNKCKKILCQSLLMKFVYM